MVHAGLSVGDSAPFGKVRAHPSLRGLGPGGIWPVAGAGSGRGGFLVWRRRQCRLGLGEMDCGSASEFGVPKSGSAGPSGRPEMDRVCVGVRVRGGGPEEAGDVVERMGGWRSDDIPGVRCDAQGGGCDIAPRALGTMAQCDLSGELRQKEYRPGDVERMSAQLKECRLNWGMLAQLGNVGAIGKCRLN